MDSGECPAYTYVLACSVMSIGRFGIWVRRSVTRSGACAARYIHEVTLLDQSLATDVGPIAEKN